MDKNKKILDFDSFFDHRSLEEFVKEFTYRYDFIDVSTLATVFSAKVFR